MPTAEPIHDFTSPNWAPLRLVVPADQAEMFMWMHACVYTDGFRLEAYKHRITRQYLHLSDDGSAYVAGKDGTPHLVDVRSALDAIGDSLEQLGWPRAATPADEAARLQQVAARRDTPGAEVTTCRLCAGPLDDDGVCDCCDDRDACRHRADWPWDAS